MSEHSHSEFEFAVSATFTAEPLERVVSFWRRELDWAVTVRFASFNQVPQTLLDPGGLFAQNSHGLNVVLLRVEDVGGAENALEIARLVREAAARLSQPLLLVLCPPSPGNEAESASVSARLGIILDDVPGVQCLTYAEIEALYPVKQWHDVEAERLGKVPYTENGFAALGTSIVRRAHAITNAPVKVIAVDCDNTLWKGICGEDGPEGVSLEPGRRRLHEFLLEQREAGILLCIASKNNEEDVWDTFAAHPEFPLAKRHFAAWRINWHTKAANLLELAAELNVGVDSFVLLDDNPKECAEAESGAPGSLAIAIPEEPDDLQMFLRHLWVLDHPVITEEDRRRAASITQSLEFNREAKQAESLEEFIAGLNLRVDFQRALPERLVRVAQLTQRTNQFNNSGIRRTEREVQSLLDSGHWRCYTAEVSDKFGEYGLVGVMLVEARQASHRVDTFLLSCRALGRGVEHRMLAALAEEALDEGVYTLTVSWRETARNRPMREFLESLDHAEWKEEGDMKVLNLKATEMQSLRWHPQQVSPIPIETKAPPAPSVRRFSGYSHIASDLRSPEEIVALMRRRASVPVAHVGPEAPSTEVEIKLAQVWSELLEKPIMSVNANFFDLGGHSLLAVMLLMRVKEEFGVELSVDDVYAGSLTLGDLARRIESQQMGIVDASEYDELLAEIEGMSDEEVRALLDQAESSEGG